ncbi:hypothetical protein DPIF89300162_130058 [Tenacibaculum maritimum]|nr:hypothetical protein DPIF89300162_130058 [Tenacibaculum maritimum]
MLIFLVLKRINLFLSSFYKPSLEEVLERSIFAQVKTSGFKQG